MMSTVSIMRKIFNTVKTTLIDTVPLSELQEKTTSVSFGLTDSVVLSISPPPKIIYLKNYDKEENFQVKIKVCELFGDPRKCYRNRFMFEESNLLFYTEICLSASIYKELKNRFFFKVNIRDKDGLRERLKDEILEEAFRLDNMEDNENKADSLDIIKQPNFMEQAKVYLKILYSINTNLSLEEYLIQLYTVEGFIADSINSALRNLTLSNSKLPLYFCLLQASIDIVSKKYNQNYASKAIEKIDGVHYYVLFRAAHIPENIIQEDIISLNEKTSNFGICNEFLSTTYVEDLALSLLFKDGLKENHVRVFYRFLIEKEMADKTPNLLCFIEEISSYPQEKEALLSHSTIFQMQSIEKRNSEKGSYFEVASIFISNGFNEYDFLKYSSLKKIDLNSNEIGTEGNKSIAVALKINTSLQNITMCGKKIGDEGTKRIADALKINSSLQSINLTDNQIGAEGARIIAEALKIHTSLKEINLNSNQIGAEGANRIAGALLINTSLQNIYLNSNQIGAEGANRIANALKTNTFLQSIYLSHNDIKDEGAQSIAGALEFHASLQNINLSYNNIKDEGAQSIANALRNNTSLIEIHLYGNQIGAEGAESIADALKINTSLQNIDLSWNQIGDEGAKNISDALKTNTSLQNIYLNSNKMGDEGAKSISDALKANNSLQKINLSSNQIGAEVQQALKFENRIKF